MQTTPAMGQQARERDDPVLDQLAELFERNSVWRRAAAYLDDAAASDVYLTTRPSEVWHVEQRAGETRLIRGAARDPDFAIGFTPSAVARLAEVDGEVGDFAVRLFRLATEAAPQDRIELRVLAPFARLVRHGYLSLLAGGGLRVLSYGATHGVRTLRELRRLVERARHSGVAIGGSRMADRGAGGAPVGQHGLQLRIRRTAREVADQHDKLRMLVREIHAGLEDSAPERVATAAAHYRDALEAHFALEENVIFPALQGLDPERRGEIDTLLNDHVGFFAEVCWLADEAADARSGDWKARFYSLRRALGQHESREESLMNAEANPSPR